PGWRRLGQLFITGRNEWQKLELTITPIFDIYAIAIGPDCTPAAGDIEPYYFFDNLVLAEESAFQFIISGTGNSCASDYTLSAPSHDTLSYQWYLNGVALPGETFASMQTNYRYGTYQVRLLGPNSCHVLPAFEYEAFIDRETETMLICAEEEFFFGDRFYSEEGEYYDTLINRAGCDSIATLELGIRPTAMDTFFQRILPGETYVTAGRSFRSEGTTDLRLTSVHGCDSLVNLTIEHYDVYIPNAFSPNRDGVNDQFRIYTGPGVLGVVSCKIFDRWGGLIYDFTPTSSSQVESLEWNPDFAQEQVPAGTYIYQIELVFDDGKRRTLSGTLALLR
ncbi:MAG: gliding motility-associated C-terminal domain-containing protein, partial [Bacteroidota bacterium]